MAQNKGDRPLKGKLTRTFFCLPLPGQLREKIASLLPGLQKENLGFRWVRPEQYHITLKFCGDITVDEINTLMESTSQKLRERSPGEICLKLQAIGAFPNTYRARVVFIEVMGDTERLGRLAALIETAAAAAGIPRETRPFRPHLTLARTRRPGPAKINFPDWTELEGWVNKKVVLMKSELHPSGPVYTKLQEWPLKQQ